MSTDAPTATQSADWPASEPTVPPQIGAVAAIEQAEALDGPAGAVSSLVKKLVPGGPVKDALSGTWLGHALHPVLTDVVIGTWLSAVLLDVVGGEDAEGGADRLIGLGMLAYLPTAASGASDWADCVGKERRVGLVHLAANATAFNIFGASLRARRGGRRGLGRALAIAGAGVLSAGGFLGGHLAHSRGVGVDETAQQDLPDEWTGVIAESDVPADGSPVVVRAGTVDVLLSRQDGRICAIDDRCTHRGGALHDGDVADGCVSCPLHGSTFSLRDGTVVRGPATASQPVFDVRVREGKVEVRAAAWEIA